MVVNWFDFSSTLKKNLWKAYKEDHHHYMFSTKRVFVFDGLATLKISEGGAHYVEFDNEENYFAFLLKWS